MEDSQFISRFIQFDHICEHYFLVVHQVHRIVGIQLTRHFEIMGGIFDTTE